MAKNILSPAVSLRQQSHRIRGLRLCRHLPIQNDKIGGGTRGKGLRIQRTMFCHKCGREFGNNDAFGRHCGTLKRREQDNVLCSSENEKFAIED